jgi:glycosyltransferase involved in cell wall biosynthesis
MMRLKYVIHDVAQVIGRWMPKSFKDKIKRPYSFLLNKIFKPKHPKHIPRINYKRFKGVIISLPTIDWNWMLQRPQHIMRNFAKKGYLCFYCTYNQKSLEVSGIKRIEKNLYLCSNPQYLNYIPSPTILITWTLNNECISIFKNPVVVYDIIDTLKIFSCYNKNMEEMHKLLLNKSDIITVTNKLLLNEIKKARKDALYVPNGVDVNDFRVSSKVHFRDIKRIANKGNRIVGYYGALANWLDYDLINFLAKNKPDLEFVFLGCNYDGSIKRLKKSRNVHYLGLKKYSDLKHYLSFFDVAILPFKINEITLSSSPLKIFEYMAGGKPVVSTNLPELRSYKSVLLSKNKTQFLKNIDKSLRLKDDMKYLRLLEKEAKENSWDKRVDLVEKALKKIKK